MILSMVNIVPAFGMRQEIVDILLSVKGPTLALPTCSACSIYEEQDDDKTIAYMELWQSEEEMDRHIRSSLYNRVLEAMELSTKTPEIRFFRISETHGIELIEKARGMSTLAETVG